MENRSVMGVHDVQAYLGEMVRTIARSLGIADVEWKFADELLGEIEQVNPHVRELFEEHQRAYWEWFDLSYQWCESGKAEAADSYDREELLGRIQRRNETRNAIRQALS